MTNLKEVAPEVMLEMVNRSRLWNGYPPLRYLGERDSRAVAKLSRHEQCEIKAFCLCGVPRHTISAVFDVTDLTVTRINNATAKKYPHVFIEVMSFNTKREFCANYITEENERKIINLFPQYARPND
jgi:hypothetical protein